MVEKSILISLCIAGAYLALYVFWFAYVFVKELFTESGSDAGDFLKFWIYVGAIISIFTGPFALTLVLCIIGFLVTYEKTANNN